MLIVLHVGKIQLKKRIKCLHEKFFRAESYDITFITRLQTVYYL